MAEAPATDTLRQIQLTELEITLEIQRVCDVLGIQWFLDSGTLLGAARHQGFIPWDDDMDLGMMKDDYETFIEKGPAVIDDRYLIQSHRSDPTYPFAFAKVRKKGTLMKEYGVDIESGEGIWVDVFRFDVTSSKEKDIRKAERSWLVRRNLQMMRAVEHPIKGEGAAKKMARSAAHRLLSVFPNERYIRDLDKIAVKPAAGDKGMVSSFYYTSKLFFEPYDEMFPLATLPFEGHDLPVFKNWEAYLEDIYGDWRTPVKPAGDLTHQIEDVRF